MGLDFNPTCFAHPKAADGFTLASAEKSIRKFWIEHCRRSREIGAAMGKALGSPCVTNVWVPDGFKDTPADRMGARVRLADSLDAVFEKSLPAKHLLDAVEPKLFGIGAEACTVGSAEFYLGYAITRKKLLCLEHLAGMLVHDGDGARDGVGAFPLHIAVVVPGRCGEQRSRHQHGAGQQQSMQWSRGGGPPLVSAEARHVPSQHRRGMRR